jgi:hypothetical protein
LKGLGFSRAASNAKCILGFSHRGNVLSTTRIPSVAKAAIPFDPQFGTAQAEPFQTEPSFLHHPHTPSVGHKVVPAREAGITRRYGENPRFKTAQLGSRLCFQ